MNLALIPLLLVALLLISGRPEGIDTVEILLTGQHEITEQRGALVIGDATVVVPSEATVPGPIYIIGGEVRIGGTVAGDVSQLAGTLVVEDGASIAGELQHISGSQSVSTHATVGRRTSVDLTPAERDPVAAQVPFVLVTLLLALAAARLSRRRPVALANIGHAVTGHPVVSLTIGALVSLTFLSLFVFMAFTLVLLPVSLVGLLVGLLTVAYGIIAMGDLLGRRLPVSHTGLAAALGVAAVMIGLQLVGVVPLIGDLIVLAVLLTAVGAVLVSYYGLIRFKPVALPD